MGNNVIIHIEPIHIESNDYNRGGEEEIRDHKGWECKQVEHQFRKEIGEEGEGSELLQKANYVTQKLLAVVSSLLKDSMCPSHYPLH